MKRPPDVTDVVKLRPEFHREDVAKCCLCGQGLAHGGLPLFYRVTVERFGLDAGACRRTDGMERYFGNAALAEVFSTGEPLGKRFGLATDLLVCAPCSMSVPPLPALLERFEREAEPPKPEGVVS